MPAFFETVNVTNVLPTFVATPPNVPVFALNVQPLGSPVTASVQPSATDTPMSSSVNVCLTPAFMKERTMLV